MLAPRNFHPRKYAYRSSMAGWSISLEDDLYLERCIIQSKKKLPSVDKDETRVSVDNFVSLFLQEMCTVIRSRPIPPLLGNGKSIDLVRLFFDVKKRGGYDAVSRAGLWAELGEDQGLNCSGCGSAIKLVYFKYFHSLEKELMKFSKGAGSLCSGAESDGVLTEMRAELKCSPSSVPSATEKKDGKWQKKLQVEAKREEGFIEVSHVKKGSKVYACEMGFADDSISSDVSDNHKPYVDGCGIKNAEGSMDNEARSSTNSQSSGKNRTDDITGVRNGDSSAVKESGSSQKRKRACLLQMLGWISAVAKDPTSPSLGMIPERSQWKLYGSDKRWKQVLLAREALFLKRPEGSSPNAEHCHWQKKQKMHPSMFEDVPVNLERSRCSSRLLLPSSSFGMNSSSSNFRKRVPIGQFFQAELPEWTGMASESDPKWLGTRFWPPLEMRSTDVAEEVDRSPDDPCGCQYPASTQCVKYHIGQKKVQLRAELGSVFYHWKFDKMGEEVAVSWTKKEEDIFKEVVKQNPLSQNKCFWDELSRVFPRKRREELVSYYFNVFVLQRRAHQNRYGPSNVDSDDDETCIDQ